MQFSIVYHIGWLNTKGLYVLLGETIFHMLGLRVYVERSNELGVLSSKVLKYVLSLSVCLKRNNPPECTFEYCRRNGKGFCYK